MKTYQDLLMIGESDADRAQFCVDAIDEFRRSTSYKEASDGEAYYNKHNLTIEKLQKFLYTLSGNKKTDTISANYKLKTLIFRRLVIQQVQYVLGNGVTFDNKDTKEKLGKDFDFRIQMAGKKAMAQGRAFGFWNYDHVEVFGYADTPNEPGFCPLLDTNTSEIMAGIRFWDMVIGDKRHSYYVLYEIDGITEYRSIENEKATVMSEKKAYKTIVKQSPATGIESSTGENYRKLPIVQLFASDTHESELIGIREKIDCFDLIESGLANAIDDTAEVYWILKNAGAMDDHDIAMLFQRLKTVHGAATTDDEADVQPYTVDIPVEARKTIIEQLRKDIYEDFQALDVNTLSAAAKTTQEIQAAYQNQDNKCADFEYYMLDFVQKILEIAGIDDNPSFVWNRVVNMNEQTQMILSASQYLSDEIVIKKLPFLTPEDADKVLKQREVEGYSMFNNRNNSNEDEPEEGDE